MTAEEAKRLSDEVNAQHVERADADLDHVEIEIIEATRRGDYNLEYIFVEDRDYSLVNEIRNVLLGRGYEVEIINAQNEGRDTYALNIDWSKETE